MRSSIRPKRFVTEATRVAFMLATMAAMTTACTEDEENGPRAVRIATFNAGLAHGFVELAPERQPSVVEGIAAIDADVVCLQEVWIDEDVDAVLAGTAATFPHEFHLRTEFAEIGPPACTETETDPLLACVTANDCENSPDGLADCTLANCEPEFTALPDACVSCIVANIARPLEELISTCQTGSSLWTYEGRNGLMLLGREPFDTTETLELTSCSTKRYAIYAETTTASGAEISVVCTHLTADLSGVPHTCPEYESWEAENAAQIDALVSWSQSMAGDRPLFVTGDFNTGPAVESAGIVAELPDNFPRFGAAGLLAATTLGNTACSYCGEENTLTTDSTTPRIIDHVFVGGVESETVTNAAVTRILDGTVDVTTDQGPRTTSISDHYGFVVELELP